MAGAHGDREEELQPLGRDAATLKARRFLLRRSSSRIVSESATDDGADRSKDSLLARRPSVAGELERGDSCTSPFRKAHFGTS